jgi:hypothetical protein
LDFLPHEFFQIFPPCLAIFPTRVTDFGVIEIGKNAVEWGPISGSIAAAVGREAAGTAVQAGPELGRDRFGPVAFELYFSIF